MKPLTLLLTIGTLASQPLSAAMVKVVFGKANTPAMTELQPGSPFTTSSKSHSEMALKNGVVRAGSNTTVRVSSEDNISLDNGLTLVASKPRFFRRSINVQTPAHQLKVKGTAQIYHDPGRSIRVAVIEGKMTVSLNSLSREQITLQAGQVLIINPTDSELPEPFEVDLNRLVSSAQLLADQFESLPTLDLVRDASLRQSNERATSSSDTQAQSYAHDPADSGDLYARPEELVHFEASDDIDDLDNDGDPDDGLFDDLDDMDDTDDPDDNDPDFDPGQSDDPDPSDPDPGSGGNDPD